MIRFLLCLTTALYAVQSVLFRGPGQGNYILNNEGLNGNVYLWVAPANGDKQGQFEAAEFLVTPKTQQVITGVLIIM
jgi:hypothetical protein